MNTSYNPFSLVGKTILVTGASSGIGRATAIECSKLGARLIITGRNDKRLIETSSQLSGNTHIAIVADLSCQEEIELLINQIPVKLNGIVLAAGIVEMWPILYATKKRFEKIFTTNLFAPIELLRNIIKRKLFEENLSIVAITSIAGIYSFGPANSIYGAGKAALSSFLKYVALETASKGVRVNTVSPGMIYTPMHTEGSVEQEKLEEMIERIPIKRWGQPQDVANASVFFLSDASSYITGCDIKVDGGITIR